MAQLEPLLGALPVGPFNFNSNFGLFVAEDSAEVASFGLAVVFCLFAAPDVVFSGLALFLPLKAAAGGSDSAGVEPVEVATLVLVCFFGLGSTTGVVVSV